MDDSARLRPLGIHRGVKKGFLGRLVAGDQSAFGIKSGNPRRVERTQ